MSLTFLRTLSWRQLTLGILSFLPGLAVGPTGGTDSARYCYSVWLRHVAKAVECGVWNSPKHVAEIGPGDTIGVGLAALITGADRYTAIDSIQYTTLQASAQMLNQLMELFSARTSIPDDDEFPDVWPKLSSYRFPANVISDSLPELLRRGRVIAHHLRAEDESGPIRYLAPWDLADQIPIEPVNMIISQAVLEHVDKLSEVYRAMAVWVAPGGFVSHTIDFRAHGTSNSWDGHWTYPRFLWKTMRGRRPWLLNREPISSHLRLLEDNNFVLLDQQRHLSVQARARSELASGFRSLSHDDLTTKVAFLIARQR